VKAAIAVSVQLEEFVFEALLDCFELMPVGVVENRVRLGLFQLGELSLSHFYQLTADHESCLRVIDHQRLLFTIFARHELGLDQRNLSG
jgi:hypothetical protein